MLKAGLPSNYFSISFTNYQADKKEVACVQIFVIKIIIAYF